MDKSWIYLVDRHSYDYMNGVDRFLDFAYANEMSDAVIKCPCKNCRNIVYLERAFVRTHLICGGFWKSYRNWTLHGEAYIPNLRVNDGNGDENNSDDMVGMLNEAMGIPGMEFGSSSGQPTENITEEGLDEETKKFFKLLKDAKCPLFPDCKNFTALSFIVRLLHLKVLSGWTNRSFTILLELLNEAFPEKTILPKSYYEANKLTTDLGFSYKTWDACPNSCMLFRNEYKNLEKCVLCNASRYKQLDGGDNVESKRIPAKQVRYFPLKPRLQRLFMSSQTASHMKWHAEERTNDGVLRHPADSPAWKNLDERYPAFASDSRNVRLGLASDGFNPFRTMNIAHSTWPVVLMTYNLPPWMCMKQPFFILSVLVDGPKGPGDKIDVFMQPLIEELNELWEIGVSTYDASSKSMFNLHAALLWTINDFPAYANLSGWSTRGRFACPSCNMDTNAYWLTHGGKYCYMGHRRWLSAGHKFRKEKTSFNNHFEFNPKPEILSGSQVLKQLKDVETVYKKEDVLRKRKREEFEKKNKGKGKAVQGNDIQFNPKKVWKKKSIFFELPYWEHNLIRHNLDVMHIEKNVCDNILFTLLDVSGKSKDNLKARLDLQKMQIRGSLHPQDCGSGKKLLPHASFTLSKNDKDVFLGVLKRIKVPDGYASNISRCVHLKERSIWGLKSHDNHILLQQLLPLAIRRVLPKNVVITLIELSIFFRQLCSKVNRGSDLEKLQDRIAITLCQLEKIFPPAFFDVMEHLPVHLAVEALRGGPVQFRWMYPVERFLLTLKLYVRNRAHPEGSIAKGYLVEECMNFCARYLNDSVETKSTRPNRNDDGNDNSGRHFGKVERNSSCGDVTLTQAHNYVLANNDAVKPYRDMHFQILRNDMPRASEHQIQSTHTLTFESWFRNHVNTLQQASTNHGLSDEIKALATGPRSEIRMFNGYIINGCRFRTKRNSKSKTTQNCGVMLTADTMSYASRKDKNPRSGDVNFYGILTDIIEISYTDNSKFVLFKCDWVDNNRGKKEDEFKFTLVNFNHLLYRENRMSDEPFILASQAEQVMYVKDPIEVDWQIVVKMTCRDAFDMISDETPTNSISVPQVETYPNQQFDEVHATEVSWVREGKDGTIVMSDVVDVQNENVIDEEESDFLSDSDDLLE